jgi:hypothetical protein
MASEVSLRNLSLRSSAEGDTHMLQFINGSGCIFNQDLDSILVTEIVAPLHGIKEIPFPVILLFIAKGSSDPSLGSARVGAGGKDFTDDRHIRSVCALHSSPKTGQTCSHNDDIVLVNHLNIMTMNNER